MKTKKSPSLVRFWYLQIRKHWLAYLVGFLFWFPTFEAVFGILQRLPCSDCIDAFYSPQFALPRYGIYVVLLLLLIYIRKLLFGGVWAMLTSIFNVLFFPFVVVALVVCAIIQVLDLTFFSLSKIHALFFSAAFFIASILAWPLCVYVLKSESTGLLIPFMIVLGFASFRLLIQVFSLGAQPLRLVDELLKYFVPKFLKGNTVVAEKLLQLDETRFLKEVREQRDNLVDRKKLRRHLLWYSRNRSRPQFVTSAFVVVFILAFLLAALTFALEFDALRRISPGSLQGFSANGFLDLLFLSVMWLSTSSPEGVIAATPAARVLVVAETLTGIGLLVFLIQCFSAVLTQDLEQGRTCARQLLDRVERNIGERETVLHHPEVALRYKHTRGMRKVKTVDSVVQPPDHPQGNDRLLPPGEGQEKGETGTTPNQI